MGGGVMQACCARRWPGRWPWRVWRWTLTSVAAFVRERTTVNPLRPTRTTVLVIAGAYRFTRNPMYLGMALLLAGWAVLLGSWVSVAAPVVFVAFITRFQIVPEERAMAERLARTTGHIASGCDAGCSAPWMRGWNFARHVR